MIVRQPQEVAAGTQARPGIGLQEPRGGSLHGTRLSIISSRR
jgi:hypothetical protein